MVKSGEKTPAPHQEHYLEGCPTAMPRPRTCHNPRWMSICASLAGQTKKIGYFLRVTRLANPTLWSEESHCPAEPIWCWSWAQVRTTQIRSCSRDRGCRHRQDVGPISRARFSRYASFGPLPSWELALCGPGD